MKTLNVTISDIEYEKFKVRSEQISFTELLDLIGNEIMLQNLENCTKLASKYGLSQMSMDEINSEIQAARDNAKNSN
jgi:hypothetical protein